MLDGLVSSHTPWLTLPELSDDSLDLAPVGGNIPEASPVVGLDGEVSQRQETQNSSAAVADQNVQNPVIPPVANVIKLFTAVSYDFFVNAVLQNIDFLSSF